jgi:hypothetical protein
MIVRARQRQRPEHALDRFAVAARVAGGRPAVRARPRRADVIGAVGVQPLFDGAGRDGERLPAGGRFDRFEVPLVDRPGADQRRDFGRNLRRERRLEPPFSPAGASASSSASARRSQAAQYRALASRNCRPVSIWRRTVSASAGAIRRVRVVPCTARVRLR